MMKDGLLERIQNLAYWRVLIRPLVPLEAELSFRSCMEAVAASKVSVRGWDYPHTESERYDGRGGSGRGEDFYESWTDWEGFQEFWRMYRSGQFLSYNLLHGELGMFGSPGGQRIVPAVDTVYSVSEFIEFSQRLAKNVPFSAGYVVTISLRNAGGYQLSAGPRRMPFSGRLVNSSQDLTVTKRVGPNEISNGTIAIANSVLLDIFDHFGWNPDPNQIKRDQEAFFKRDFG
ncbi:hypothetical protein [Sphingomonas sp. Leaf62]|uniref:hypothetical protein n=1 Tax=Sphingomonas sp. Leaf62 TaxID=1736228 RepID=UPI0012E23490|nr:hypothetical protein [Sphingomonas sp. Leaf62]